MGNNNARPAGGGGGGGGGAAAAAAAAADVPPEPANNDGGEAAEAPQRAAGQRRPGQEAYTTTISAALNVKKDSITVGDQDGSDGSLSVRFAFDSATEAVISVFFMARPSLEGGEEVLFETKSGDHPPRHLAPKGMRQEFLQPSNEAFDIGDEDEADLVKEEALEYYPLVIVVESADMGSDSSAEGGSGPPHEYQRHTSYCTFVRKGDAFDVKVLRQVVKIGEVSYELMEIYGIGPDDNDAECCLCLTEPRDTTILPCRHMCICHACARELRQRQNRCPICRSVFQSLLAFEVRKKKKKKKKKKKQRTKGKERDEDDSADDGGSAAGNKGKTRQGGGSGSSSSRSTES